jgi:peptidyl-prolyl cis-trans isomerase D
MIRFLQDPGPLKKAALSAVLLFIAGAMVIVFIPGIGSNTNSLFGTPKQGVVATVDGQEVTSKEVLKQAQLMVKQQLRGQNSPMAAQLIPFFAGQAADRLITQKALVAEAKRLGLKASDDDVRDELQNGRYSATFFPGGKFIGKEAYENLLAQNDLTPQTFEAAVKDDILTSKLIALLTRSASVSDKEVHDEFEKRNTKIKFDYAVLSLEELRKGLNPADAELKAYYEAHKATYNNSIPEKRKIEYVFLDRGKLMDQVQLTPQDLQTYYNQHQDEYRVPEQVKLSHILIKTPAPGPDGKVDDKAVEAARVKAEDVLKQVKAGGKFDELAKKYSDDPGSAKQGGELGWIGRGRTVPEFEKAAFSLPAGQISDLVKSNYGFHIIRVEEKQDAHVKTLDEVKAQIEPLLKQQKVAKMAEDQANAMLAAVKTDGFQKAATAKGLNVVTTDFINRGDALPGIGVSPQFMNSVFTAKEKGGPDLAQLPQGYTVFQVDGIKPPATPTFDEIRTRVENEFKNEQAQQLLNRKTQELSDRAKSEHDLKRAAKELGATVKTSEFVGEDGQVPDIGSMSGSAAAAFELKPGEISAPFSGGASGTNGIVIQLLEKQAPSEADFAAKKDGIREGLLQNKQQELFGLFLTNLRQQMEKDGKIRKNEQELKTLTSGKGLAGM